MRNLAKRVRAHLAGITASLAVILFVFGAPSLANASSLKGLMSLREMAHEAVPYEMAIANHKPTFLEFYADWCTTCQSMAPTVQALHEQYRETVNFVMLNVDDPQWSAQTEQYQVTGIPQMTVLDGDQAVVETWIGKVPKSIMAGVLAQL